MLLFRVKVDPSTLKTDQTKNGYLAAFGSIVYYTHGFMPLNMLMTKRLGVRQCEK